MIGRFLCRIGWHDFKAPGGIFPGAVRTTCRRCNAINPNTLTGQALKRSS
jgi:hypothetical protein